MKLWKLATIMFAIVIGAIAIYTVFILLANRPLTDLSIAKTSLFGESFGAISTLFSGLAFAGLMLTIHLQRQELAESKIAFKKERFEDTYFKLLDYYQQNLNYIRIIDRVNNETHCGVGALNYFIKQLNISLRSYNHFLTQGQEGIDIYCFKLFTAAYKSQFRQTRYLGTLECLLELIEKDCPTVQEREAYWRILSSQLTGFEVSYIFYICLVAPPDDNLRNLIHRSTLIQHPIIKTMINKHHISIYEKLHDIHFNSKKPRKTFPYDKKQLRQIRKNLRKADQSE